VVAIGLTVLTGNQNLWRNQTITQSQQILLLIAAAALFAVQAVLYLIFRHRHNRTIARPGRRPNEDMWTVWKEWFMSSEAMHEFLQTVEAEVQSRPTPIEFEMAYQARIAIDRIRFAIKHNEQFAPHTDQMRETGLQLLDALQRLEAVDRRFQVRSRFGASTWEVKTESRHEAANGASTRLSNGAVSHTWTFPIATSSINEAAMLTLLTETDVAKRLKVNLPSLRRWRLERRGPTFVVGALVRYRPEDLESWVTPLPTTGERRTSRSAGGDNDGRWAHDIRQFGDSRGAAVARLHFEGWPMAVYKQKNSKNGWYQFIWDEKESENPTKRTVERFYGASFAFPTGVRETLIVRNSLERSGRFTYERNRG
jgi:hypothetical protein